MHSASPWRIKTAREKPNASPFPGLVMGINKSTEDHMRKGYSSRDYECLFDNENQITIADLLRHDDVLRYRTKTITSGKMVECEIYPVWKKAVSYTHLTLPTNREV